MMDDRNTSSNSVYVREKEQKNVCSSDFMRVHEAAIKLDEFTKFDRDTYTTRPMAGLGARVIVRYIVGLFHLILVPLEITTIGCCPCTIHKGSLQHI